MLNGGPWSFKKMLLLLDIVNDGDIPQQIHLCKQTFWVQAFGIPLNYMTVEMGKIVGQSLSSVVMVDHNRHGDCLGDFLIFRVALDVFQPLCQLLKVRLPNGTLVDMDLLHERLPVYCFLCGCFDHV